MVFEKKEHLVQNKFMQNYFIYILLYEILVELLVRHLLYIHTLWVC